MFESIWKLHVGRPEEGGSHSQEAGFRTPRATGRGVGPAGEGKPAGPGAEHEGLASYLKNLHKQEFSHRAMVTLTASFLL